MLEQMKNLENRNRKFNSFWNILILTTLIVLLLPGIMIAQVETSDSISWIGPDGTPLPFQTHAAVEDFLKTAKITSAKVLTSGITHPVKVMLEADGVKMKAVFRYVNEYHRKWKSSKAIRKDFHDSCKFELAAYRLSRFLANSKTKDGRTLSKNR